MKTGTRRALIFAATVVVAAGVVFVGLRGCTVMPWNSKAATTDTVTISVTRDFGRVMVRSAQVRPRAGETVLEMLKSIATVETEYGGGFVSAIDGMKSSRGEGGQEDWFYYVNGVLSELGSAQKEARPGDMVWWDLHPWNQGDFVSAVVGAYPRPFTSGYSQKHMKSTVMYGTDMETLARDVGAYLAKNGASITYSATVRQPGRKGGGPTIIFLSLKEALETPWVADLTGRSARTGAFVSLQDGRIVPLDAEGQVVQFNEAVQAAVVSAGSGMGDASPVWLVLCDGEAGAAQARRVLLTDPGRMLLKAGAAVGSNGTVYSLPGQVH